MQETLVKVRIGALIAVAIDANLNPSFVHATPLATLSLSCPSTA